MWEGMCVGNTSAIHLGVKQKNGHMTIKPFKNPIHQKLLRSVAPSPVTLKKKLSDRMEMI
jgi:hypothetical protein